MTESHPNQVVYRQITTFRRLESVVDMTIQVSQAPYHWLGEEWVSTDNTHAVRVAQCDLVSYIGELAVELWVESGLAGWRRWYCSSA